MRVSQKVLSEEDIHAAFDGLLERIKEDRVPLAAGFTAYCPDGGWSNYYTPERVMAHLKTCVVCQERRAIHQRAVRKLMD